MRQENNVNIRRVVKMFAMSSVAIINLGWKGTVQLQTLEGDSYNETFSQRSFLKTYFDEIRYGAYLLQLGLHPAAVVGKLLQK
jgi:hypothetical protein